MLPGWPDSPCRAVDGEESRKGSVLLAGHKRGRRLVVPALYPRVLRVVLSAAAIIV